MARGKRTKQGNSLPDVAAAAPPAAVDWEDSEEEDNNHNESGAPRQRLASHVRDRQRAIAEREAARLARPEQRKVKRMAHADKKKSAVSSTPFGVHRVRGAEEAAESKWCGPWSVARQMIAKREEAKRKREEELEQEPSHPLDDLMKEHEVELKQKEHPSVAWKGNLPRSTPASTYAKRQRRADLHRTRPSVPSLVQLCVDFVVSHFEYVESLGDVGNDIRVDISKELVARNKLDAAAFQALVDPTMETLELVDCSGIPQETMAQTIATMTGLRYLLLTHAGRSFGPRTVASLLQSQPPNTLCCLSISGAYLLNDQDAAKLIQTNSETLQSISFDTCPLLKTQCIQAISESESLLELALNELTLSQDDLNLLANPKCFAMIKNLTLTSLAGLTDTILKEILKHAGQSGSLETLDIGYNHDLAEEFLSGIRQYCGSLRSLTLNGLKGFGAEALEALFFHPIEGLPRPPHLRMLQVGDSDYQAVTDECLKMVTAGVVHHHHQDQANNTGNCRQRNAFTLTTGLTHLNVQGATLVTDAFLEDLVETSAHALVDLNVSYCPLVTDRGLGYLVSKCGTQLSKIHVWGCAQLTDEFFEGHSRVDDPSLELLGAWMKKSGTRSLR